jgi:hypothetical protein
VFAFEERLDAEDGSALWARGEIDAGEVFEQCAPVIRSCGDSLGGRVVLAGPIPICESCNSEFGRDLEAPVSRLFADVEEGRGLTDGEAELMVRWMWKFEGYAWKLQHLEGVYSTRCTLRQRVVRPIDQLRGDIVLALSLVAMIDPQYRDAPMGLDSECEHNALFVSGVFSRLAIMIVLKDFTSMVPPQFSKYRLLDKRKPPEQDPKLFFPATRFATCTDAVATAVAASGPLGEAHDAWAEACLAAAGPDYAGGRLT